MSGNNHFSLFVWAARDIQRSLGRAALLFVCLTSLVFLIATTLLFGQALDGTWARLVEKAPNLIIRRIDSGGWAPLPVDEAIASVKDIPGVLDPTPRLWGVASGPNGPVTVIASALVIPTDRLNGVTPPSAGQAIVGRKVARAISGRDLTLVGRSRIRVEVIETFPDETDLATYDVVWVAADDARRLLGLTSKQASDLAIHLFRMEEEKAIQADLSAAFPWPVSITARNDSALRHHTLAIRTGGIGIVTAIPALLAFLLLIADVVAGSGRRKGYWGLLQAMGWTTGDLIRLQTAKAMIVGVPAILSGLAVAYGAVFYPSVAGYTAFWLTGSQRLPELALEGKGAALVMVEVALLVGLPYLATVFLTCLRSTAGDVWNLMQADSWN